MKKIIKNLIKKNILLYVLAFLIPFLIGILGFYICLRSNLISNNTILYGDLQAQYVSLFSYLQDVVRDGSSLGFSFIKGLGGNMISTISYYLMSPINLLILFVSKADIPFMMLVIVLIKIGLAGIFMYKYLSYVNKEHTYKYLIFSTCYALSSYVVNYFFCIMWLDAIYLLPLVCLGIHKIIENKSSLLYIVVLFITIFTNYYMGYMVCIFACLYFVYEIISQNKYKIRKELGKYILKFIIPSLLAGMLCMFLLIPMVNDLSTSARSIGSTSLTLTEFNFNFGNLINRLLFASHNASDILNLESINIYIGILMLPLLYFYFVNRNIDKKEKLFSTFIIFFFLISYCSDFINCAWHGFAYPNGLNFRYTYIFMFYFLIMASKSFMNIKEISKKHYIIFLLVFLFVINIVNILNGCSINYVSIYISIGLLILYLLLLYNIYNNKYDQKMRNELSIILVFLVFGELLLNLYLSLDDYFLFSNKEYKDYITTYSEIIDEYKADDNAFYRIGETGNFTYNPGLLFDYYGMSNFLSTNNVDTLSFLSNHGYFANTIAFIYHDNNNIIVDSILAMEYYISGDCGDYEEVDTFKYSGFTGLLYGYSEKDYKVCYNKNALPLGFMVSKNIDSYGENVRSYSNLAISEAMLNKMNDEQEQFYYPYDFIDLGNNSYKVKIGDEDKFYVTVLPVDTGSYVNIYVNDDLVLASEEYPANTYVLENEYQNQEVEIRIEFLKKKEFLDINAYANFYSADTEKIFTSLQKLQENPLELEVFSDNYIKGNVVATEEKSTLFTTIPYDKGWSLYVDGVETTITKQLGAFVGIELMPGEHTIELKHTVSGVKLGACISSISLVLTAIYLCIERKKRKESQIMLEK